jgi:hypothetical protein
LKAFGLASDELDYVNGPQGMQIDTVAAETLSEELPRDAAVALDRRSRQALLPTKVLLIGGSKIIGRGADALGGTAGADAAQVLQQADDIAPLCTFGLRADSSAASPPPILEPHDARFGEIGQRNMVRCQPPVERHGMQRLDVDNGRHVLLPDQLSNERAKMLGQRTGAMAHERGGALIRTFQDALLTGQ